MFELTHWFEWLYDTKRFPIGFAICFAKMYLRWHGVKAGSVV
jgi:hypothetical protein